MSGKKPNSKSSNDTKTGYVYANKTFEMREVNGITIEDIQIETDEHECTKSVEGGETDVPEPSHITLPVIAAGNPEFASEKKKNKQKEKPYIRLDQKTDVNGIPEFLFDVWKMNKPDVIFSVLSDSECATAKGNEVIEGMANGSIRNVCRNLVTAASSTNAWIITGGLNKGIDHFIGSEVMQRLANRDMIPRVVLGISNWGCLADTKDLLKDPRGSISNPTELSLNQHHTHFILVDDGKRLKPGPECSLRQMVEFALRKRATSTNAKDLDSHVIYILIGGSVNAFGFVERALATGVPIIIATKTGGAADIICGTATSDDGATLDYLPEIVEKPFRRLEDLLATDCNIREVISQILTETKLEPFFEIVELLDTTRLPEDVAQKLLNDIAAVKCKATNELLAVIKTQLASKKNSNYSTVSAEFETVNRLRAVFGQMLAVRGITQENAKKAVDAVEPVVLSETIAKALLVSSNLKALRTHDQTDLLTQFDIEGNQKEIITSVIIETIKKQKSTKPRDVFMLAVDWDDEIFFRQLLLDKWKWHHHKNVFMELLKKDKNKYVKLIIEQNCNSRWLIKPDKDLKEEFKKIRSCRDLLAKIKDSESKADNRIMGKVLFVWCIWKQMPETAMLFWKRGQDCLAMALVAYQDSGKQKKDLTNQKGYEQMRHQTKIFSKHTINFVRRCYEDNNKHTHDLLIGKVRDLDDRTPLQIAVDADFMAFVSEVPIQDLLNKIWIKDIKDHDHFTYVPLVLSEACPLLAPKLLEIPDDSNQEKKTTNKSKSVCKYFLKVKSFLEAPLVKFSYGFISFLAYLTLFSIVLLTDFQPKISPTEIALAIWTFILITEELKQAVVDIREYQGNKWNYFDITAITLYIIGFILRMIYHGDPSICPSCLYVARIVLAFSLMIFFFRTLQFLSIYESLGPKIFMMYQLVADLVSFFLILAVFIAAYGVVSNVILYPQQPLNAQLLKEVFNDAWWSVLTQFNMDALGSKCPDDLTANVTAEYCSSTTDVNIDYALCKENLCPANDWIVPILLAVYSLITCVMLLNVLIAIFNSTFEAINDEQKEVSRMQRYRLIREFSSRSMVPPPLCVFTYPYHLIQELRRRCKGFSKRRSQASAIKGKHFENNESPINDNEEEDVKGNQHVKKSGQSNVFEKDLISAVKDWEHHVVSEYFNEKKEKKGWYVARLESETEKANEFDETPFMQIHFPADS